MGPWTSFTDSAVTALLFVDANTLLSGGDDGRLPRWDLKTRTARQLLQEKESIKHPDGRRLASGAWDATTRFWSLDAR